MPFHSLKDLYLEQLRDLYDAEQQIVQAMPKMIKASSSPDLKQTFQKHLDETRFQVERLDLIFKKLGETPQGRRCKGIAGIIEEGDELIGVGGAPDVADAALIASAQRVEHYEIAGYGCARTFADRLDDEYASDLLQKTLDEESAADQNLTDLAESGINQSAGQGKEIRGSRLTYVNRTQFPGQENLFSDVHIVNAANDDLGQVDGFVVDRTSGRPYYVVVDSGGWFIGNRYLLPINSLRFDRSARRMRATVDKDTIKKYPKFEGDAFERFDDRSREYENRLLEVYGGTSAREPGGVWDYERIEVFRQPEWWITEGVAVTRPPTERGEGLRGRGTRPTGSPVTEDPGRSRVPDVYEPGADRERPSSEGRSTVDERRNPGDRTRSR